jgi:ElaB/YqjD/DUF883 family membrane-anchored ribosome-binding protein
MPNTTSAESHTLYLDLDDEITSVIDRIGEVEGSDVTLVVPKSAVLVQSIVNLKLLKRAAERSKKSLVLVTRDETGQLLAQRAGFKVKATLTGNFLAVRRVAQSAPMPTIEEDGTSHFAGSDEPIESREQAAVQVRPGVAAAVEAEQQVARPRRAVQSPQRQKVLPRVSRSQQAARSPDKMRSLVQRVRSPRGTRSSVSARSSYKAADTNRRVGLLPDLPWKKIGIGAAAALFILFMSFTFFFAHATVTVTPKSETAAADFELTAKEQPDAAKHEILGKLIELSRDGKKTVTASGSKETGEKATGSVTINNLFSNKPQAFGVNTRLQSSSGQVFLLTAQVSVPGATVKSGKAVPGSVSASVVAEKFGEEYNVGPTGFAFIDLPADQQKQITASSDSGMSGGSKKQITVLTNDDLKKAGDAVKGELEPTLTSEIKSKLESDQELLDGATNTSVTKTASSVKVGDEAGQVEVTVTVRVQALVNRPEDIKAAAKEELKKSLPANQQLQDEEEPQVTWTKKAVDFEQKKLIVAVHTEKNAAYLIDPAALQAQLLGKSEDEAQQYVSGLSEVSSARVHLSPFWRSSLPKSPKKVEIKIND